jgi:hypothetical protein
MEEIFALLLVYGLIALHLLWPIVIIGTVLLWVTRTESGKLFAVVVAFGLIWLVAKCSGY